MSSEQSSSPLQWRRMLRLARAGKAQRKNRPNQKPSTMDIHFGRLVRQKMEERKMTPPQFAKALNKHAGNISLLFRRKEFHCKLLRQISEVLQYDFFQHYSKVNMQEVEQLKSTVEKLEKEIALLKRENELLVQANNWLSKGK